MCVCVCVCVCVRQRHSTHLIIYDRVTQLLISTALPSVGRVRLDSSKDDLHVQVKQ